MVRRPLSVAKTTDSRWRIVVETRPVLLDVRDLKKYFPIQRGFFRRTVGHVRAVDGVSFTLHQGETLGLVGESGCGKTTTGRVILRAYDPTAGQVLFRKGDELIDVARLGRRGLKELRRDMQIIFQDPFSSLNPRMTVLDIVGEPLQIHRKSRGDDLKVQISDRVAVMYLGRMVELAPSAQLYAMPRHPYTEALLSAVPLVDPDRASKRIILAGDVPNPANPPAGCVFHPRCRYVKDICKTQPPEWRDLGDNHWVACHRAEELNLVGAA